MTTLTFEPIRHASRRANRREPRVSLAIYGRHEQRGNPQIAILIPFTVMARLGWHIGQSVVISVERTSRSFALRLAKGSEIRAWKIRSYGAGSPDAAVFFRCDTRKCEPQKMAPVEHQVQPKSLLILNVEGLQ